MKELLLNPYALAFTFWVATDMILFPVICSLWGRGWTITIGHFTSVSDIISKVLSYLVWLTIVFLIF